MQPSTPRLAHSLNPSAPDACERRPPPAPLAPVGDGSRSPGAEQEVLHWELKRNCALAPRQLLIAYLVLCVPTVTIAALAHHLGSPLVAVFSTIELLCVAAAMLIYARHARDREILTLQGSKLLVDVQCAEAVQHSEFDVAWLRVEDSGGPQKLCKIAQAGRELRLGRHVAVARRQALVRELRAAVQAARHRQFAALH